MIKKVKKKKLHIGKLGKGKAIEHKQWIFFFLALHLETLYSKQIYCL